MVGKPTGPTVKEEEVEGKTKTGPYNNGQNCLLPTLHHLDINTQTCTAGYESFGTKGLKTPPYGYFSLKIEITKGVLCRQNCS
jgi:hypothetical protein